MPKAKKNGGDRVNGDDRPIRVAIVGGGCAGLTAAWQLSKLGYAVSVYERSWRLGGKGASSRAQDGRILEHGLHVWLGFYENAFRMIRECYAEVARHDWGPHRDEPESRLAHASFEEAFVPEPNIGVAGEKGVGPSTIWTGFLPPAKGLPGDPLDPETNPFTIASYLQRCAELLKALMLSVVGKPDEDVPGGPRPEQRSTLDELLDRDFTIDPTRSPDVLVERIAQRFREGSLTVAAALLHAVTIFETILQDLNHSPQLAGAALNLLKAIAAQARKQLRDLVAIDQGLQWKTDVIDIVMTIMVGLYRDRVLLDDQGLDALNDIDYRDWLRKHGATDSAIESRFIAGIYDLVFAYERGDRERPKLAAGVALRGALRMFFTYRGSMFWRMRSGMGDAVFAPLYKTMSSANRPTTSSGLRPATVRFHFLHDLTRMAVAEDPKEGRFVSELTFATGGPADRIANPGDAALDHFGCWPELKASALAGDGGRTISLRSGVDFDVVIVATGLEGFAGLVGDLSEQELAPGREARQAARNQPAKAADGRLRSKTVPVPKVWTNAVTPGRTVGTRALQVWLTRDLQDLGWFRGSGIISGLGLNYGTWADMTHTLGSERDWRSTSGAPSPSENGPRSVAYFCGVVPDNTPATAASDLHELLTGMESIWPAFDASETSAIANTFALPNVDGSDRYSLSLPGTIRDRLSPLDRSLVNLTVAGDWTACGLDAGCVEAAVMSGMLAAVAITGDEKALEAIIGYDHP